MNYAALEKNQGLVSILHRKWREQWNLLWRTGLRGNYSLSFITLLGTTGIIPSGSAACGRRFRLSRYEQEKDVWWENWGGRKSNTCERRGVNLSKIGQKKRQNKEVPKGGSRERIQSRAGSKGLINNDQQQKKKDISE